VRWLPEPRIPSDGSRSGLRTRGATDSGCRLEAEQAARTSQPRHECGPCGRWRWPKHARRGRPAGSEPVWWPGLPRDETRTLTLTGSQPPKRTPVTCKDASRCVNGCLRRVKNSHAFITLSHRWCDGSLPKGDKSRSIALQDSAPTPKRSRASGRGASLLTGLTNPSGKPFAAR
jgi:hypothetical protein